MSAKPSAKSSRSGGVASITACEMPLNTSATGTSSASQSCDSVGRAVAAHAHRHGACERRVVERGVDRGDRHVAGGTRHGRAQPCIGQEALLRSR